MDPTRLYTLWVAAPRTGATPPSRPRPRESWDPHSPTCSVRRPRVALRSRAMTFVLSHHGHARGTVCSSLAPGPVGAAPTAYVAPTTPLPLCPTPCSVSRGHRPPAPFSLRHTMSDRSSPSRDSPSPAPDAGRGSALCRGPFPIFLMHIAQSCDADSLRRDLDMLKDDALEAANEAVQGPDPALSDVCDALRWKTADGTIQAITAVTEAWTSRGLLLTATVTVATSSSKVKVIEHVPMAIAETGPLLEYISKDPDALTAALVKRWSPGHAPISVACLRHIVFRSLYLAHEKAPPPDTDAAPEIENQNVSYKLQEPISQFLPPHLRPTWDRLQAREVVAAF